MSDQIEPIPGEVFVRRSSGLVRELGLRDAFLVNFGMTGAFFSISLAFMISQSMWAYPESIFGLGQLLSIVLSLPLAFAYAMLAGAMPRAGGDYVYTSRILHPAVGFVANWGIMMMLAFFVAWAAFWGGAQGLSTVAATLGHTTDQGWLIDLGTWFSTKTGAFITGAVLILIFAVINVRGVRAFAKTMGWVFAVGLGGTAVALLVLAVVSNGTFVGNFNNFMQRFTDDPNYYQTVIDRARGGGVPLSGSSFGSTIAILPILAFSSLFIFGSAYVGGEVRQARRVQMTAMPLALIVFSSVSILIYYLLQKLIGQDFLVSVNTLWYNGELSELPISPFFNLFATNATENALLALAIGIGYLVMSLLSMPMGIMVCTRMVFAWSFDRIFPAKLSEVNEKYHSPVNAIAFVTAIALGFLAILVFTTWLSTLGAIEGMLPAMIFACIACAVLPFRRPDLLQSEDGSAQSQNRRLSMVIVGVLGAAYASVVFIAYLVNDLYGVNSRTGLIWIAATFGVGLLVFLIAWAVRRAEGYDLMKAYKEIPPA